MTGRTVATVTESNDMKLIFNIVLKGFPNIEWVHCENKTEILKLLKKKHVDVLLSDNRIGDSVTEWGVEIVREVKELKPDIRTVLFSADPNVLETSVSDRFFMKPFRLEEVRNELKYLLQ